MTTDVMDPPATERAPRRAPTRLVAGLVALVLPLALAEVAVRAIEDRLPIPAGWGTPEIPYKLGLLPEAGADVLVLGSSVTDAGVDPSLLDALAPTERGTFNGSLGAGTLEMVAVAARELWLPALKPKVVVLGVVSRDLNANDPSQAATQQRFFDGMQVGALLGTENLAERIDRALADTFALWRHRGSLRSFTALRGDAPPGWSSALSADDGQYRLFAEQAYEPTDALFDFIREGALADWAIGQSNLDAIRDIIKAARAVGARVLLVDMPTHDDWVGLHPRGVSDMARYRAALQDLADELQVPLMRSEDYGDEDFADVVHLNEQGAEHLTEEVAEELAEDAPSDPPAPSETEVDEPDVDEPDVDQPGAPTDAETEVGADVAP